MKYKILTDKQNKFWADTFNTYREKGFTMKDADRLTWIDCRKRFPRLR